MRRHLLTRAGLAVVGAYAAIGGATGTGLLTPAYRLLALIILGLLGTAWLLARLRGHWPWHATPFRLATLLWAAAFALSLVANQDSTPRILIGLWFAAVYFGLWYMLADSVANRAITPRMLIELLLETGAVVMLFAGLQAIAVWRAGGDIRLSGLLDNPNFLAAFLILVIPFAALETLNAHRLVTRLTMGIYTAVALLILVDTDSRGSWVGLAMGLGVMVLLLLVNANMLSLPALRRWWAAQKPLRRVLWIAGAVTILAIAAGGTVYVIRSLNVSGRGLDFRTYIYDVALQMFREKPLTGYGEFTFGRGLLRLASTPPLSAHNSAHNIVLNVMAETGLVGLLALGATLVGIGWAARSKWRSSADRMALIGAIGALVAIGGHHLTDDPTTLTPIVVLAGMIPLTLATIRPESPVRRSFWIALPVVWIIVMVAGTRNYLIYRDYFAALRDGSAEAISRVVAADPANPIYHFYDGYLLGQDSATRDQAINAYRDFVAAEPYYTPGWVNLAALYRQAGRSQEAVDAMHRAYDGAPQSWVIAFLYGTYAEDAGQIDSARAGYGRALTLVPDAAVYPEWNTPIAREVALHAPLSITAQTVQKIAIGHRDAAATLWASVPPAERASDTGYLIDEWLALAKGDRAAAETFYRAIDSTSPAGQAFGAALLAQADSDSAAVTRYLNDAHGAVLRPSGEENERISAIAYSQYWTIGLPDYFLPGVFNPGADGPTTLLVDRGVMP
ncbi:MAG TPA: O-antigen ligase family protein [Aggregatilineales bacterium]|nr:O-antigen ligase family protein [Aggregatilineales bacterium]